MKSTFIALLALLLPVCAEAQVENLFQKPITKKEILDAQTQKAVASKIPMENGKVVFRKTIESKKTDKELYAYLAYWVEKRYEPEASRAEWTSPNFFKNLAYSQIKMADKAKGIIVCQGAEEMIFRSSFAVKNWTEFYYTLTLKVADSKIEATVSNISYIYTASDIKERIMAEDWITDKEAFNKKGRPIKNPTKFRMKTIDVVNQIFNELQYLADN